MVGCALTGSFQQSLFASMATCGQTNHHGTGAKMRNQVTIDRNNSLDFQPALETLAVLFIFVLNFLMLEAVAQVGYHGQPSASLLGEAGHWQLPHALRHALWPRRTTHGPSIPVATLLGLRRWHGEDTSALAPRCAVGMGRGDRIPFHLDQVMLIG